MLTWPRCSSPSCWCARGPRVIASTGVPWTVDEVTDGQRAPLMDVWRGVRFFQYRYMEAADV
jgi:hypothetical protein